MVIAIIAILAAMLLPALTAAKIKAQAIRCMSDFDQMQKACIIYTGDFSELYPPNPDTVSAKGYNWVGGGEGGDPPLFREATLVRPTRPF